MAFCGECGNELADGAKFCNNCGAPADITRKDFEQPECYDDANGDKNSEYKRVSKRKREEPSTLLDKLSRFFGIILLILVFADFQSDPPVLTIILSLAIIAGAIFCLAQRYKLKGFTIIALLLAVFCLMSGISQGKRLGFMRIPGKYDYNSVSEDRKTKSESSDDIAKSLQEERVTEPVIAEDSEDVIDEEDETLESNEEIAEENTVEAVDGVDPELKAFLDSYEEFVDEYVEFMKSYMANPGNVTSMLNQYTEIMKKYADFADAVDKYDSNDMSVEDAKYYLDVTNRCTQKMLDIY